MKRGGPEGTQRHIYYYEFSTPRVETGNKQHKARARPHLAMVWALELFKLQAVSCGDLQVVLIEPVVHKAGVPEVAAIHVDTCAGTHDLQMSLAKHTNAYTRTYARAHTHAPMHP